MSIQDDFYTLEKVAEKLEVTEKYVRDQIASGELIGHKRGKRLYVLHSDLVAYISAGSTKIQVKEK